MLSNAKHEHFAQMVAKGKSAPQAYVIAGYSEKTGYAQSANRLIKKAEVSARIAELRKAVEEPSRERAIEKAAVDKAWVLHELIEVVRLGKSGEAILDSEGKLTGEYKAAQNLNATNKALELVGKELGMFIDRSEVRTGPLDGVDHDEIRAIGEAIASLTASGQAIPGSTEGTRH